MHFTVSPCKLKVFKQSCPSRRSFNLEVSTGQQRTMATRTGRLIIDPRSGKMVEEYKEDLMAVALFDPNITKPEDYKFRFVPRSEFTVPNINLLFECNAALLKDPFSNTTSTAAFFEDDQLSNQTIDPDDLLKEINMRTVRLRRLRHGDGELMVPTVAAFAADEDEVPLDPIDESFHFSSIGGVYSGAFRLGRKQGQGQEYTMLVFILATLVATLAVEMVSLFMVREQLVRAISIVHSVATNTATSYEAVHGSFVEGPFVEGQPHGRGRQLERHGDEYEGFFDGGARHGRGTARFEGGRSKHMGFWHEDAMDGRGDFYYRLHDNTADNERTSDTGERKEKWEFWYEGAFMQMKMKHARDIVMKISVISRTSDIIMKAWTAICHIQLTVRAERKCRSSRQFCPRNLINSDAANSLTGNDAQNENALISSSASSKTSQCTTRCWMISTSSGPKKARGMKTIFSMTMN
ncbi:hypothetical protein GQ600_18325 [Phytophthora cactorum]|nr:hypothetical protein GQ600_18325 [Phytophthora cactorum]